MMFRVPFALLTSFAALASAVVFASACSSDDGGSSPQNNAGSAGATGVAGNSATAGAGASAGGNSAGKGGSSATAGSGGVSTSGGSSGGAGTSGGGASGGAGGAAGGSQTGGAAACIICDDFESATNGPDPAKWTIDTSRMVGTATVDSTGARGSAKSIKVAGGYLKIDAKAGTFTGVASKFWVRVYMKFDQAQPSDHVTYLMLTDATKSGELRVGAQNTGMHWNYSSNDTILPDYNEGPNSLKPTANEWHCFEFQFDSDTPEMHAYMDGQESTKMLLDATSTAGIDDRWQRDMPGWKPKITSFAFGSGDPTAGKVTTWFDEIAISNERPGCAP